MNQHAQWVLDFHGAFGLPWRTVPTWPPESERLLRAQLILEEAIEACSALGFKVEHTLRPEEPPSLAPASLRLAELGKELADLEYVTHGTSVVCGLPMDHIFRAVHQSNMSKLVNGFPQFDERGKVLKGPNYYPPDILQYIEAPYGPARMEDEP